MPLLAWSSESASTSTSHRCYVALSTGCQWPREYSLFKIAALTFDCVRGAGPDYFKQVIRPVSEVSWSLRSVSHGDLFVSGGKHVHRPTKFFYRGSCRLERTSTRPTLTAHQLPTVPIQAENSFVPTSLQHCMIPLRIICRRVKLCNCCNLYLVIRFTVVLDCTNYVVKHCDATSHSYKWRQANFDGMCDFLSDVD